ncbi:MAG TPA: SIS domain-containing protein [Terriglobales bacterium]|nr:SIS domain-containing protein [Terriglobales bacterium]
MSASAYRERLAEVMAAIWATQLGNMEGAAAIMANTIAAGGLVHVFGSGHSVLPLRDIFPRYGSYPEAYQRSLDRKSWNPQSAVLQPGK